MPQESRFGNGARPTRNLEAAIAPPASAPGEAIRALRKRGGLTLRDLSLRTGLAVSTLSKLEKGSAALSYDKLVAISQAIGVDLAELLGTTSHAADGATGSGRRVVQRAGEGQAVDTQCYRQLYVATELLNKRFTPLFAEVRATTMEEFTAEFGGFIRHPGEEFVLVLDGEIELRSELYAPLRLARGDSVYFDSGMGHAYLKAAEGLCRVLAICAGGSNDERMIESFVSASQRGQPRVD